MDNLELFLISHTLAGANAAFLCLHSTFKVRLCFRSRKYVISRGCGGKRICVFSSKGSCVQASCEEFSQQGFHCLLLKPISKGNAGEERKQFSILRLPSREVKTCSCSNSYNFHRCLEGDTDLGDKQVMGDTHVQPALTLGLVRNFRIRYRIL